MLEVSGFFVSIRAVTRAPRCPLVPLTPWNNRGTVGTSLEGVRSMAKCPACDHDVRTPFFLNLDGWSHLTCTQCKARLEMKPLRTFVLAPLMGPLFVLARQGRIFEVIAFVFMFATIFLVLVECARPKVQVRKSTLPKPAIRLNIDGPPD